MRVQTRTSSKHALRNIPSLISHTHRRHLVGQIFELRDIIFNTVYMNVYVWATVERFTFKITCRWWETFLISRTLIVKARNLIWFTQSAAGHIFSYYYSTHLQAWHAVVMCTSWMIACSLSGAKIHLLNLITENVIWATSILSWDSLRHICSKILPVLHV